MTLDYRITTAARTPFLFRFKNMETKEGGMHRCIAASLAATSGEMGRCIDASLVCSAAVIFVFKKKTLPRLKCRGGEFKEDSVTILRIA